MNKISKVNPKVINGLLITLILALGALMIYLAGERDLMSALGWKEEEDIVEKNMSEIRERVYDYNMNVKIKIPNNKLLAGIWKDAVKFDENTIIIFPEDDCIKILDIENKEVRSYDKEVYKMHLNFRYNGVWLKALIPSDPARLKISELLLDLLYKKPKINENAPVLRGCLICEGPNGFKFMSNQGTYPIKCNVNDILDNIYPNPEEWDWEEEDEEETE